MSIQSITNQITNINSRLKSIEEKINEEIDPATEVIVDKNNVLSSIQNELYFSSETSSVVSTEDTGITDTDVMNSNIIINDITQ